MQPHPISLPICHDTYDHNLKQPIHRIYKVEANLRAAFAAVGATNEIDVTAAVLIATSVPPFESLQTKKQ